VSALRRGEALLPRRRRALLCLRTSVPHGDRVSAFKSWRHTRAHSSETEKSNFCSCLLLPPRVAHHVVLLCGSFRLHHRRRPCQNARRWLVTGRLGQLIEEKLLSRTGRTLDCFERSDIVLLLAPAANMSPCKRACWQQSDGRPYHPAARSARN